jgi:HlyD family secretion protein
MKYFLMCAGTILLLAGCDNSENQAIVGQLASDRLELTAEFAEPVLARHVVEGETITAGTRLISLDTARIDARLREVQALAAQQEARLAELTRGPRQEQIAAARASVDGAHKEVSYRTLELQRATDIFEKQAGSLESVDRARIALDTANAELDVANAKLEELLAGTTVEELRQAEQQLAQTAARIEQLQLDRERHTLNAPVDGIVDSLLIETGERPQAGQALAILLAGEQPYARVYVPENLRVQVAPGSRARVMIDGRNESFGGRVRWVSSDAAFTPYFALTEHDRGRLSYVAKVDLDYNGPRLPDGVPLTLEFDLPGNAIQP